MSAVLAHDSSPIPGGRPGDPPRHGAVGPDADAALGSRDTLRIDALHDASDASLVVAVGRYQHDALAEIYRRHASTCLALARRLLRDQGMAEEVVQEVFLRLWNEPAKFDPDRGALRTYLLAQTHGRSVDRLRSEAARRRREERDALREVEPAADLEQEVWQLAMADTVRQAMDALPPAERQAIELAYFGGHTYREVAVILEQPEGTIKSRIRAGLGRLRTALETSGVRER